VILFGLFLFSIQDIIIKYFSSHYSVLQIVFTRGLIALGLFMMYFQFTRVTIALKSQRPLTMIARGLLGFCSYTTYYLAVAARLPSPCRCS
jgi:drug/metabolite transporter (DMT)-like permease